MPREMRGEGAPRPTIPGVLGETKESGKMKSLGGLVEHAPSAPVPKGTVTKHSEHIETDRHICGQPAKTKIPGQHYGQVPYAGKYMSDKGHRL